MRDGRGRVALRARLRRARHAVEVARVARQAGIRRILGEIGATGDRPATPEGARAFRLALEELGTTYIKLGQLLSSRPDLLPDVYVEELERLVDSVPPVPYETLRPTIEGDIGPDTFVRIDEEPLAAASIAQIHAAVLKDGRAVVAKVRRPGVEEQVARDLELLRSTTKLAESRSERARVLRLEALGDELEAHLLDELDFREEANNAEVLGRNLADVDEIVVPRVIRPYVTERVLVLERLEGRRVASGHGLPPERARLLARAFFRSYVRQVTVHGIYHADPHRGNVLLTGDERLALLDFGLLGRLDDDLRRQFALLLLAVAQNRADDVAGVILGQSLTTLRSDEAGFVHELRRKLPRYQWRSLAGVKAGHGLADLQRIALRHGISLPTTFALVGKTLAQAESIARVLDPELDPVELLEEDALEVMLSEAERRLEPTQLASYAFTQLEPLARMPRKMGRLLDRAETGTLRVAISPTDLHELEAVARGAANRLGASLVVVGLLVSSALIARVHDLRWIAGVGFALSVLMGLYMVWKIIRTPGEL